MWVNHRRDRRSQRTRRNNDTKESRCPPEIVKAILIFLRLGFSGLDPRLECRVRLKDVKDHLGETGPDGLIGCDRYGDQPCAGDKGPHRNDGKQVR